MMENRKLCILADDLTGALDTGVKFTIAGLKTRTIIVDEPSTLSKIVGDDKIDVLALDTETRALPPSEAYKKISETIKLVTSLGYDIIYQKIDSTLRGNIGLEIDALIDVLELDAVLLTPAFIDQGRIVVGGYELVRGIPLLQTPFSKDPHSPITESYLPSIVASQSKYNIKHIDIETVAKGSSEVERKIRDAIRSRYKIVTFDASVTQHLENIAVAYLKLKKDGFKLVASGSAGLASPLAKLLKKDRQRYPVMIIAASVNEISIKQVEKLIFTNKMPYVKIDIKPLILEPAKLYSYKAYVKEIVSKLKNGADVVIRTVDDRSEVDEVLALAAKKNVSKANLRNNILETLTNIANDVLNAIPYLTRIIVTGGDTTYAFLKSIKAKYIDIIDEVLSGIPLCKIKLDRGRELFLITKAGGFGDENTLINLYNYLKNK